MSHGRIEALGHASDVAVPQGARIVDAPRHTLLPGFIDAHVHIGFYEPQDVLRGGVTTVRDLGWPELRIWPLAEASRSPDFDGPTILAAGPMLTVAGGYPTRAPWAPPGTGLVLDSADEVGPVVARLARAGATIIKVALNAAAGPTLDAPLLTSIVDAAHEHGLKVTGHTFGLEELHKALDAGMDELAHMLMSPEPIPQDTIDRMVGAGMAVVPTLSIFFGSDRRIAIENLGSFLDRGGRVIYGTDLGNEGPSPGIDAREVAGMVEAGMTAGDVVASATVRSAGWLGLDHTGLIQRGMDADIVAVRGDPLQEWEALTRVEMVWRKGRRAL
jgi:imidazolonepropionase-like amidohydrolase